jgi:hypothetical protein
MPRFYGNQPIAGRRLCTHPLHEGPRWILAIEFQVDTYSARGTPVGLRNACRCCERRYRRIKSGRTGRTGLLSPEERKRRRNAAQKILREKRKQDPQRLAARRLSDRLSAERKRRARGVKPRNFSSPYGQAKKPLPVTKRSQGGVLTPTVDAGPLLEVFERWRAIREGEMERERGDIGVVAIDELLGESGARAVSRARQTGRMEIATADRILYAMNSHLSIHDLWPEV